MKKSFYVFVALSFVLSLCFKTEVRGENVPGEDTKQLLDNYGINPIIAESKTEQGTFFVVFARQRYSRDTTNSQYGIYMQKVKDGVVQWSKSTTVSNRTTGSQTLATLYAIGTNDGGCVVTSYWRDMPSRDELGPWNIVMNKVDANGTKRWERDITNFLYSPDVESQSNYQLGGSLTELANGTIITVWYNSREAASTLTTNIYARAIAPNGVPLTPAVTLASALAKNPVSLPLITHDSGSNFFISYYYDSGGNGSKARVQKYTYSSSTFTPQWSLPTDVHTDGRMALFAIKSLIPDGRGGVIVTYDAKQTETSFAYFSWVQHVNKDGVKRWNTESSGLKLASVPGQGQSLPFTFYYKERETLFFSYQIGSTSYQGQLGMGVQAVDFVSGELEWGTTGKTLYPLVYAREIACQSIAMGHDENPAFVYRLGIESAMGGKSAILLKKTDFSGYDVAPADQVISPTTNKLHHAMYMSNKAKKGIVVWMDADTNPNEFFDGPLYFQVFSF